MKIGIDCRIYGDATNIGRYVEGLVSYITRHATSDEFVLFMREPQFSEFSSLHDRIRKVLVSAPFFSIQEQTVFLSELYRERLDLMHFMGCAAPIGYLRPTIVTIHDLLPLFYPDRSMSGSFARFAYRTLLRSVTRHARQIVSPARHIARDLSEMANVEEEKILVIPCGIDLNPSIDWINDEMAKKYRFQQGIADRYFLFVWDVTEHTNLARFLRACANIRALDTADIVIVGREEPSYHEVREMMIELGLQKRIHIIATVDRDQLEMLYQGAWATFSPSLYEGYDTSLLTSVRMGVPVVCSGIPGFREMLGPEGAVFFRPLETGSIEESLRRFLADETIGLASVASARKMLPRYSSVVSAEEMLRTYHQVLAQTSSTAA